MSALLEGGIPFGNLHLLRHSPETIPVEPTNNSQKPIPVACHTKTNSNRMESMATGITTSYLPR